MIYLALAIATLGPAPAAVEKVDADCVRHEPLKVHRSKPVKRVYRPKRIFKSEPKPIVEENCGEGVLPPAPSVALEPPSEDFTPVPTIELLAIEPPDLSVPPVQAVEEGEPCACFNTQWIAGVPVLPPAFRVVVDVPATPAIPEPSTWALLMGSMLAGRLWPRRRSARSDNANGNRI